MMRSGVETVSGQFQGPHGRVMAPSVRFTRSADDASS